MSEISLPDDFVLTDEFKEAFYIMNTPKSSDNYAQCIYITGKAGTGKSTLLQYFKQTSKKKVIILAPTGIAAINVGGQTIHSFFEFPIVLLQKKHVDFMRTEKRDLLRKTDTIIIDEISMVRADVIDAIDWSLRLNMMKKDIPFGGKQIIMIGDIYQLPPVVESALEDYFNDKYKSPYFFSANIFKDVQIHKIQLKKIFRQTDNIFIDILNSVRNNNITSEEIDILNERKTYDDIKSSITLTATNSVANKINQRELFMLDTPEKTYQSTISGAFDVKSYPTDEFLTLKVGAQVMLIKNDNPIPNENGVKPRRRYVNGTIGEISELNENNIIVNIDGRNEVIELAIWEKLEYTYDYVISEEYDPDTDSVIKTKSKEKEISTKIIGRFVQYPFKLAYAITVHKSQGKTFDSIIIDFGFGAFAHGQAYVGLSRVKSLEGLHLRKNIKRSDIILDNRVVNFMDGE